MGHRHQAEHGLALALNLAMGPNLELTHQSAGLSVIRIVKALFWADSAEKRHPAPPSWVAAELPSHWSQGYLSSPRDTLPTPEHPQEPGSCWD